MSLENGEAQKSGESTPAKLLGGDIPRDSDELLNPPTTSELLSEERTDLATKGLMWGLAGGIFVGVLKSVAGGLEHDLTAFLSSSALFSTAGCVAGGLIGGGAGFIAQKIDSFLRSRS